MSNEHAANFIATELIMLFIIFVMNLIYTIMIAINLSKVFGCGGGMIALLILLKDIGYFVLGIGSYNYKDYTNYQPNNNANYPMY